MTDGEGTFYDKTLESAKNENIKIYTIGLGTSYNKTLLEKIAGETWGKYYHVKTGDEIGDITDDIHGDAADKDMDGDGIPDKEDNSPYEFNINTGDFVKGDKVFLQADKFSYESTDNKIGSNVQNLNLGNKFELIKQWKIIDSDDSGKGISNKDSGFGAVAMKNGNDIIISFKGSGTGIGQGINDWIKTDFAVIGMGGNSKQVYSAYNFMNRVLANNKSCNIYITGHSLGGWLAQKIGGSLLNGKINLTKDSQEGRKYYSQNQIPINSKNTIKNMYNQNFKYREDDIKKIVTFAAPGFTVRTHIYDDEKQMRKTVYNYKMNKDIVSQIGESRYLLGRNKWMMGPADLGVFEAHSLDSYYKKYNNFFNNSTFEKNE